ncbi:MULTISPECIES: L-fucose mutarotase [Aliagarivorans]|uniref:L-fucose mutarotase n=1 Tax=Aliagarivorans TaxID=882379 RepID=UPI0004010BD0|nr:MULTISPECIES: L-fucose mutarotase [Aliagarivorans]
MLKGISPLIPPELLYQLARMGHGDELVLSDIHFPAHSCNQTVIQARGCEVSELAAAICELIELDQYVPDKAVVMKTVGDDRYPEGLLDEYQRALPKGTELYSVERFEFYDRTQSASCVVVTGTTRKYGNLLLKKGVTPTN